MKPKERRKGARKVNPIARALRSGVCRPTTIKNKKKGDWKRDSERSERWRGSWMFGEKL